MHTMLSRAIPAAALALALMVPVRAFSAETPGPVSAPTTGGVVSYSPDRVIVEWEPGVSRAERVNTRTDAETTSPRNLGNAAFQVLQVTSGQTPSDAVATLKADPKVRTASRDGHSVLHGVPNDSRFGELWGLQNSGLGIGGVLGSIAGKDISAPAAWDKTIGIPSTVVADLDSGYRFQHPDLAGVAWTNPAEVANGLDDDANGIVDDVHGADFVGGDYNAPTTDGDPTDDIVVGGGHGVHTAGTIAARGNDGVGITGVAQNTRIMPLRVCGFSATFNNVGCPFSSQIAAINYAGAKGVRAANASLGSTTANALVRDALAHNPQTLFVISAGNGGDDDVGDNNDAVPTFPCNDDPSTQAATIPGAIDNVVCVAATDQADRIASFSNWGAATVDLAAPGTEILSTSTNPALLDEGFRTAGFPYADWVGGGYARVSAPPLSSFGITNNTPTQPLTTTRTVTTPSVSVTGARSCTLTFFRKLTSAGGDSFSYQGLVDNVQTASATGISQSPGVFGLTIPVTGAGPHTVKATFNFTYSSGVPTNGIWLDDVAIACFVAPGEESGTSYGFMQGTSMAAPHVTGAAALLASYEPLATTAQLKQALLQSTDPVADLHPVTGGHPVTSGGRLNADAALAEIDGLITPDTSLAGAPPSSTTDTSASFTLATARTNAPATFECSLDGAAFTACVSPQASTGLAPGPHAFQTRAKDGFGNVDATPAGATWTVVAPAPQPQPQPPPQPQPTPRDTTAPVLSTPRAKTSKGVTSLTFTASEAANLRVTVEQGSRGRKVRGRCVKETRTNRRSRACTRFAPRGSFTAAARAGSNTVRLPARVGGRTLGKGTYRLTVSASDAAGNAGTARTITVTVTRR